MLTNAQGELSVRSSRGLSDEAKMDRKRIGEGISGTVAQTGRSMLLSGRVQGGSDPTASESMIAPLRSNGRTLGVVNVKHRATQERYGQIQVDSLTQAASEIAAALLTAEEFQRAEEDRRQALVLYELSRFATLGNDPHNDLESAVAMLADNLRHDAVGVWAAEEHHLRLRAATGYGDVLPSDISTSGTDTVLAQVLRERRTATAQYGMAEDRPDWAAPSSTHFLLAPIGGSQTGVVLGVLVLGRATRGRPPPPEWRPRGLRGNRRGPGARALRRARRHPHHRRGPAQRRAALRSGEREGHPPVRRRSGRRNDRGRRQGVRVERAADR